MDNNKPKYKIGDIIYDKWNNTKGIIRDIYIIHNTNYDSSSSYYVYSYNPIYKNEIFKSSWRIDEKNVCLFITKMLFDMLIYFYE